MLMVAISLVRHRSLRPPLMLFLPVLAVRWLALAKSLSRRRAMPMLMMHSPWVCGGLRPMMVWLVLVVETAIPVLYAVVLIIRLVSMAIRSILPTLLLFLTGSRSCEVAMLIAA